MTSSIPDPTNLSRLADEFRRRAAYAREYAAAEQAAHAWERAAEDVERALEYSLDERLDQDSAVLESGYTWRHLQRLAREETIVIEDDGTILRRHLPRKPGHGVTKPEPEQSPSKADLARSVASGG